MLTEFECDISSDRYHLLCQHQINHCCAETAQKLFFTNRKKYQASIGVIQANISSHEI